MVVETESVCSWLRMQGKQALSDQLRRFVRRSRLSQPPLHGLRHLQRPSREVCLFLCCVFYAALSSPFSHFLLFPPTCVSISLPLSHRPTTPPPPTRVSCRHCRPLC
jgi:hypothetical protein